MQIHKGYKYRLKTNRTTGRRLVRFAGACRFVWNKILSINAYRYVAGVPRLSYVETCTLLAWWKESEEYGWLREVHSQVLQQCLKDLDHAYANLFAGRAHPPRYRKKFLADSFRYPQGFKVEGRRVFLPMIGWVEFWHSRPIEGAIKNVTVSRRGLHKAILDQGWRTFRTMLEYKQGWRGGDVIAVNPRYTSQTCPVCGHVSANNRVQQALFSCEQCGYTYHADVIAAQNILALGHRERLNACSSR